MMLLFSFQELLVVDDAELLWGVQSVGGAVVVAGCRNLSGQSTEAGIWALA